MKITTAAPSDLDEAVSCLTAAFAQDPITGFLLQTGVGYPERVSQFFSLLMRARIALGMPVLVARDAARMHGGVMVSTRLRRKWPNDLTQEWDRFESSIPGLTDRFAVYDEIAARHKPSVPHYYLGVIGTDPHAHGRGIGTQLLEAFCELSAG